jgi:hypothetical protein
MWCAKCENGGCAKKLCPISFGLAVGVVSFFAVMIWTLWVIHYGMSPMMLAMHIPAPTLEGGFVHALLALIKGFLFGFFVALLYDLFACCFACRKKSCDTPPQNK